MKKSDEYQALFTPLHDAFRQVIDLQQYIEHTEARIADMDPAFMQTYIDRNHARLADALAQQQAPLAVLRAAGIELPGDRPLTLPA